MDIKFSIVLVCSPLEQQNYASDAFRFCVLNCKLPHHSNTHGDLNTYDCVLNIWYMYSTLKKEAERMKKS